MCLWSGIVLHPPGSPPQPRAQREALGDPGGHGRVLPCRASAGGRSQIFSTKAEGCMLFWEMKRPFGARGLGNRGPWCLCQMFGIGFRGRNSGHANGLQITLHTVMHGPPFPVGLGHHLWRAGTRVLLRVANREENVFRCHRLTSHSGLGVGPVYHATFLLHVASLGDTSPLVRHRLSGSLRLELESQGVLRCQVMKREY